MSKISIELRSDSSKNNALSRYKVEVDAAPEYSPIELADMIVSKLTETENNRRRLFPNDIDLPSTGFLRAKQVLQFIPVSPSDWWRGVTDGRYPEGVKMSPRVTVWRAEDVRNLIEDISRRGRNDGGEV